MVVPETLDQHTWEDYLSIGKVLLMLGKTSCRVCAEWTLELTDWQSPHPELKVAKIQLDQSGLGRFKMANPWLVDVDLLPWNVLFVDGEPLEQWAGAGLARLENRLQRIMS